MKKVYVNKNNVELDYNLIKKGRQLQLKINKKRSKKREKLFGIKEADFEKKYNMSKTKFQELNDVNFNVESIQNPNQLKRRINILKKQSTKKYDINISKTHKKNLIQSYETVFKGKVDEKKLKRLTNLTKQLSPEDLDKLHYLENIGDIDYIYGNARYSQDEDIIQETFNNQLEIIEKYYHEKRKK